MIGAGGFIGRHLSEALSRIDVEVLALSSRTGSTFEPVTGAFCAPADAGGVDAVAYLAQSPHYRDLPERVVHVWGVNVYSVVAAADWATRCGAARFLYASSGTVYAPSFSPHHEDDPLRRDDFYALSKVQGEESAALFEGQLAVFRARLFGVYGPQQRAMLVPRLADAIRRGHPVRLQRHPENPGDAGGLRLSLCYVDDAVAALVAMLTREAPRVMNVAGSGTVSMRDLAEVIGRHVGVEPQFEISTEPRAFDLVADTSRMHALLGRDTMPMPAGIGRTVREPQDASPDD